MRQFQEATREDICVHIGAASASSSSVSTLTFCQSLIRRWSLYRPRQNGSAARPRSRTAPLNRRLSDRARPLPLPPRSADPRRLFPAPCHSPAAREAASARVGKFGTGETTHCPGLRDRKSPTSLKAQSNPGRPPPAPCRSEAAWPYAMPAPLPVARWMTTCRLLDRTTQPSR